MNNTNELIGKTGKYNQIPDKVIEKMQSLQKDFGIPPEIWRREMATLYKLIIENLEFDKDSIVEVLEGNSYAERSGKVKVTIGYSLGAGKRTKKIYKVMVIEDNFDFFTLLLKTCLK